MKVEYLDLHSNQITSEGFYKLMVCLKINNKVKSLNISKNQIASDLKVFKMVHKFLNCNKVLEVLNLAYCDINEKAGEMIGKGLRGNTNLQSLILKGNPIKNKENVHNDLRFTLNPELVFIIFNPCNVIDTT